MSQPLVVVLDYGSGNVHSAAQALQVAGARVELTRDRDAVLKADGLLVPGVGAFTAVMDQLNAVRGGELIDRRLIANKPVLGICVGMQIFFAHGVEHGNHNGVGIWPATVEKLEAKVLPHMGWNTVTAAEGSALFQGVEGESFYFVHSYAVTEPPLGSAKLSFTDYDSRFLAAIEDGVISATQFHPEKSGDAGLHLIKNWVSTL